MSPVGQGQLKESLARLEDYFILVRMGQQLFLYKYSVDYENINIS